MSSINALIWERYTVPIREERSGTIEKVLASVRAEPGCLLILNIEDDQVRTSPARMKRFLEQSFGDLLVFSKAEIVGNDILFNDLRAHDKLSSDLLSTLVRSQLLFVVIFGACSARDVPVVWDDVYAGRQSELGTNLRLGEVAVLRVNLRSQDNFEMCVARAASAT